MASKKYEYREILGEHVIWNTEGDYLVDKCLDEDDGIHMEMIWNRDHGYGTENEN